MFVTDRGTTVIQLGKTKSLILHTLNNKNLFQDKYYTCTGNSHVYNNLGAGCLIFIARLTSRGLYACEKGYYIYLAYKNMRCLGCICG